MRVIDGPRRWPGHYLCYACMRMGIARRASIRAFTGAASSGGGAMSGGWPACWQHADYEIERALLALLRGGRDWEMDVWAVEPDDDDWPTMTRMIFRARPRPNHVLQGAAHAT